ncbi:hypothetical protein Trydic_g19079 [Trypoxylus dichotomus]
MLNYRRQSRYGTPSWDTFNGDEHLESSKTRWMWSTKYDEIKDTIEECIVMDQNDGLVLIKGFNYITHYMDKHRDAAATGTES